jgi:hypothetical protein
MRMILTVLALLLVGGCGSAQVAEGAMGDGFTAVAQDGRLVLRNGLSAPVHYTAIEEETAALVDLHFDPNQWPAVPAGSEVRVPFDSVMGYSPEARTVIVHWWSGGTYGQALRVPLR